MIDEVYRHCKYSTQECGIPNSPTVLHSPILSEDTNEVQSDLDTEIVLVRQHTPICIKIVVLFYSRVVGETTK
jgi:hypothetical protein